MVLFAFWRVGTAPEQAKGIGLAVLYGSAGAFALAARIDQSLLPPDDE